MQEARKKWKETEFCAHGKAEFIHFSVEILVKSFLNTVTWFPQFFARSILNNENDEMPKATLQHSVINNF